MIALHNTENMGFAKSNVKHSFIDNTAFLLPLHHGAKAFLFLALSKPDNVFKFNKI